MIFPGTKTSTLDEEYKHSLFLGARIIIAII